MKSGWGGRWWYLLNLTYFSGVTFFREGLRYFQGGGVVEKFSRGSHVGKPPTNFYIFFENRRGTKEGKTDEG